MASSASLPAGSLERQSLAGRSVTVVGAGVGGLSTAAYLAKAGADVTVLEKNEQLGGRASRLHAEGFRFDMGPSWYLMPDVFDRFFEQFGRSTDDYYGLTHLDPHYRVFWKDGDRVDVVPDRDAVRETFESYEPGAGAALDRYLETSRRSYEVGMDAFVYRDRTSLRDLLDPGLARSARGLPLLRSMEDHVARYFDHPKLRQLVQYSLVFLGGAPSNTPAIYNLMSHVDVELGVHYPDGGLGAVVDALADLGTELGVAYETDAEVLGIRRAGAGLATRTATGDRRSDLVVSGADYAHTERDLLAAPDRRYGDDYWRSRTYAPSAFLLYLGVEGDVEPLAHHTLVLPTDWDAHFASIFDRPAWPEDPAYYLCVPSQTDDTVAPAGHSNLFALVPIAPGLDDGEAQRRRFRDRLLADIAANTGVELRDRIVFERAFTVSDFAGRYHSTNGTALGLAHTLRQTGPLRPSHRSSRLDGLYYTGAYTTPGIGVPMCLISGEHAAGAVLEDRGA